MPVVGPLMPQTWFHFVMSWAGAIYDLMIPFLLLNKKTRNVAFLVVVIFHIFTTFFDMVHIDESLEMIYMSISIVKSL